MTTKKAILTTLLGLAIFAFLFFLTWRIGQYFIRAIPATKNTVIWGTLGISAAMTIVALVEIHRVRK